VAGAAALVKGAFPAYSPAQIQSFLEGRATDMGAAGKDSLYGYGRLNLGTPPGGGPGPMTRKIYLPRATRSLDAPALNPVNNPPGSNSYTVSWSSVPGAATYLLQESIYENFAGATTVYLGPNTSWQATGKADGNYFYRVMAQNAVVNSGWSGAQKVVVAPAGGSWTVIMSDDFEGNFPGPWQLWKYGAYDWGKRTCRPSTGGHSAWAIGGSGAGCGSNYPDYISSWMYHGPFSLSDATAAQVKFDAWSKTEPQYDRFCIMASTNDDQYYGTCWTGEWSTWRSLTFDLSNVYTLGDLRGKPQVWIAFIFDTDESNNFAEGAYVDNVVVRKCTTGSCGGDAPETQGWSIVGGGIPAQMTRPR
jgi:hypothetical protein